MALPSSRGAPATPDHSGLIEPLTERELDVLALLSERLSNKEIESRRYGKKIRVK